MIKLTFWVLVKDIWGAWRCFGHSWNNFTGLYSLYFLKILWHDIILCVKKMESFSLFIFVIYRLKFKATSWWVKRHESEQHVVSGVFSIQKVKYLAQIFLPIFKKIKVHYKDIIKNNKEYYITKFSFFFCSLKKIEFGLFL